MAFREDGSTDDQDPRNRQPRVTTQPVGPKVSVPNDPNTPAQVPAPMPAVPTGNSAMPAGMDPALAAIYQKHGMTPADRGTGFADWQYWQGVGPSQYARLDADIAGNGTDQPTGTPGSGAWQSSGAADRAKGGPGGVGSMGGSLGGWGASSFQNPVYQPGAAVSDPRSGQLYDFLMGRAQQGLNVSPDDPIIQQNTNAYRAEQDRATKNYLSAAAERGGQNANLDAEARSASEKAGQNTAGFQAQLMQQELSSRRAEIQQALQGAQGLLTAEQAMKLQDELAHLNTALSAWGTTQSLGANESQFARQLAERGYEYDSDNQFRNSPLYGG